MNCADEQHDVALDYVITNAYVSTAQSLLQHQQQRRDRVPGQSSGSSGSQPEGTQDGAPGNGGVQDEAGSGTGRDVDGDVSMGEALSLIHI